MNGLARFEEEKPGVFEASDPAEEPACDGNFEPAQAIEGSGGVPAKTDEEGNQGAKTR